MSVDLQITPKGEITWETHDLSTGRLYLPPSHNDRIDLMSIVNSVDEDRNRHKKLGIGMEGVVYDIAGYAVKAFIDPADWNNVNTLRVNVALAEGLRRIAQPQNSAFEITGVDIYGAFVPHEDFEEQLGYRAVWLMEKIESPMKVSHYLRKQRALFGHKAIKSRPLPSPWQRKATYGAALEYYGLEVTDILNDENEFHDVNLIINTLPQGRTRGRLVKIDERPV